MATVRPGPSRETSSSGGNGGDDKRPPKRVDPADKPDTLPDEIHGYKLPKRFRSPQSKKALMDMVYMVLLKGGDDPNKIWNVNRAQFYKGFRQPKTWTCNLGRGNIFQVFHSGGKNNFIFDLLVSIHI